MTEPPTTPPPSEPPSQTPPPSQLPPQAPASSTSSAGSTRSGRNVNFDTDEMRAAVQRTHQYDLGIIAAGVLAFIFSLIPSYYTVDAGFFSDNFNAWHGFWGWFGAVLALAGAAVLAANLFAGARMPFPVRLTVLGLFAAALICTIIAGLTWAGVDTHGVDVGDVTGHGIMYWLCLIVIVAGTALAVLRKDEATA